MTIDDQKLNYQIMVNKLDRELSNVQLMKKYGDCLNTLKKAEDFFEDPNETQEKKERHEPRYIVYLNKASTLHDVMLLRGLI